MKAQVTESGVYDQKGGAIEIGTVINVEGDELPPYLTNKAVPVVKVGRVAVVNPKADEPVVSADTVTGGDTQAGA